MSSRICLAFRLAIGLLATSSAGFGCTDTESATNLHLSGPPVIEQVRMTEDTVSGTTVFPDRVFAFGTFPGADPSIEHPVTQAAAKGQSLRIIFGKLLLGNYLQQIQCRAPVNVLPDGTTSAFDNVPLGATPDDIAKCCTASTDVLQEVCGGPLATCICHIPGGCGMVDEGKAVGIVDVNQDGSADLMRFMPDSVGFKCTANGTTVSVGADLDQSYWNPSGFQQAPYTCKQPPCYDQVGPAIILVPASVGATPLLPTNMTCGLTFAPDIVDHSNIQPCAAPMGRPPECEDINLDKCTADQQCTPGDVSAFSFHTESMFVDLQGISDGDVGVSRTSDVIAQANVPIDPGSIATIQVLQAGAPYAQFTVALSGPSSVTIHWTNATGLAPNTMYTITFPTTFADTFHQGLPAPISISFTTGAT